MKSTPETPETDRIVFVTGLSGAGMSSTLNALEDLGYEVFDNFPLGLVDPLLKDKSSPQRPIAFGIDTRSRNFDPQAVIQAAERLSARVTFLTCDEAVLQKRFTETRRRHPLAGDRPVSAGIKREQTLLHPMKQMADPIIDTTETSIHDLRRIVAGHFAPRDEPTLQITVMSFGFKYGIPREADIVMDVRFLCNPYWEADLKSLTGLDQPVIDYVNRDQAYNAFLENFKALLKTLLPRYTQEGKTYLTIAMGCTGGRHRSVHIAQALGEWLTGEGMTVATEHRDMDR